MRVKLKNKIFHGYWKTSKQSKYEAFFYSTTVVINRVGYKTLFCELSS